MDKPSSAIPRVSEIQTLTENAFSQAVEARKRCEYVRQEIASGDIFGAAQDLQLADEAIFDLIGFLNELQELVGEPDTPKEEG